MISENGPGPGMNAHGHLENFQSNEGSRENLSLTLLISRPEIPRHLADTLNELPLKFWKFCILAVHIQISDFGACWVTADTFLV